MQEEEKKPRLHIHTGGLIILIIILLILFKVDIKSKIESPQFQKNIAYIEGKFRSFWEDYFLSPFKSKASDMFIDLTNKGVKQVQDNFSKNMLQIPTVKDIEEANPN